MQCRIFNVKQNLTIIDGAYPFLALQRFCKELNIKGVFISRLILKRENSVKAFWVYCKNERQKLNDGTIGYQITEERRNALKEVGIGISVYLNLITFKTYTAVWVSDEELFKTALQTYKTKKSKTFNDDTVDSEFH